MYFLVWSSSGFSVSLSHTHIGLPWGFNFNFLTNIPSLSYGRPPPPPLGEWPPQIKESLENDPPLQYISNVWPRKNSTTSQPTPPILTNTETSLSEHLFNANSYNSIMTLSLNMAKIFLDFKYFCIKCPSKNDCLVNKLGILNKIFNPPKSIKPFLFKKRFICGR